jgi:hypothetical protein
LGAALVIFVLGVRLAWWVITSTPVPAGADLREHWKNMGMANRMIVIAGFITGAWGLGALVDNLVRKMK